MKKELEQSYKETSKCLEGCRSQRGMLLGQMLEICFSLIHPDPGLGALLHTVQGLLCHGFQWQSGQQQQGIKVEDRIGALPYGAIVLGTFWPCPSLVSRRVMSDSGQSSIAAYLNKHS